MLHRADPESVAFFGTWMSRDSVYLAPVDAQKQIIAEWLAWFRQHADDWQMPPKPPDIDDWYL
jgi:hypothetical protein